MSGDLSGLDQRVSGSTAGDLGNVTHLSDIYALGCIAYRIINGQVPFDSVEVMTISFAHVSQPPTRSRKPNPTIPVDLEAIVLQLLAKQHEDRVQSCRDLAALLSAMFPVA